jgi:hypothetical protein
MNVIKGFFIIILIVGIVLLCLYFLNSKMDKTQPKIIYKYIPRTLQEEEESPIYVSEIFKTMFSQKSTWIDDSSEMEIRRQEMLNKYFISLV